MWWNGAGHYIAEKERSMNDRCTHGKGLETVLRVLWGADHEGEDKPKTSGKRVFSACAVPKKPRMELHLLLEVA